MAVVGEHWPWVTRWESPTWIGVNRGEWKACRCASECGVQPKYNSLAVGVGGREWDQCFIIGSCSEKLAVIWGDPMCLPGHVRPELEVLNGRQNGTARHFIHWKKIKAMWHLLVWYYAFIVFLPHWMLIHAHLVDSHQSYYEYWLSLYSPRMVMLAGW